MPAHDLIVIGAGPGGYVAAIRGAQLGLNVACVEREPKLGGTCLRVGCIPSKAMLESSERFFEVRNEMAAHGIKVKSAELDLETMLKRKDDVVDALTSGVEFLFKKNKVTRYAGVARFAASNALVVESEDGEPQELSAKHILIATGSVPISLPGVELDHDRIGTSTEALAYGKPPKSLAVIGAGYIGLELGSVWGRLGSEVTVLEYLPRILPGMDVDVAREAQKLFERHGLSFRLGARVTAARVDGKECVVECEGADPLRVERVLVSVGRKPNTENLGLDAIGVAVDDKGRIKVDEVFRTSVDGVYAVGDVIPGPMLAHKAEEEGIACVEQIVTGYGHVNYHAIPAVVYTNPEIASVGQSEEQLTEAGAKYRKGVFYFRGNGRARALGMAEGHVKIMADEQTDRILGACVIGPRAGDLIAEIAIAIEFGATAEDLASASHAHPTLAEVIKEAALAVHGRPIHS